jgi:hypothetical protein
MGVRADDISRLLIERPPRSLKSIYLMLERLKNAGWIAAFIAFVCGLGL